MKRFTLAIILVLGTLVCFAAPKDKKKVKGGKQTYVSLPDQASPCLEPHTVAEPHKEPRHTDIRKRLLIFGIDVSHHQGRINWSETATDHQVSYCYIKATESNTYVDNCYAYNIREARKAGVKAGAYHFFSPSTPAAEQLRNMTSVVRLEEQDLIPMIDVEKMNRKTNVADFTKRLKAFLSGFERHYGIKPIIYTGQNFFNKYLAGHFAGYKFMIAKYRDDPPIVNDKNITVLMWQFSCEGSIGGIKGPCDQSVILDEYKLNDILITK